MKLIKKIKLHNFKRFQEFCVEFDDRLNLLIGNNEAGKSSILSARGLSELKIVVFTKDSFPPILITIPNRAIHDISRKWIIEGDGLFKKCAPLKKIHSPSFVTVPSKNPTNNYTIVTRSNARSRSMFAVPCSQPFF